jgi:hypothetical protein
VHRPEVRFRAGGWEALVVVAAKREVVPVDPEAVDDPVCVAIADAERHKHGCGQQQLSALHVEHRFRRLADRGWAAKAAAR